MINSSSSLPTKNVLATCMIATLANASPAMADESILPVGKNSLVIEARLPSTEVNTSFGVQYPFLQNLNIDESSASVGKSVADSSMDEKEDSLFSKILNLADLQEGWDGYDGQPPSQNTIGMALGFYAALKDSISSSISVDYSVGGDGDIFFVFKKSDLYLSIGFDEDSNISFYGKTNDGEVVDGFNLEELSRSPSDFAEEYANWTLALGLVAA